MSEQISDFEEKLARSICAAEGVDPEHVCHGVGARMPKDWKGPAWMVRLPQAKAVLDVIRPLMLEDMRPPSLQPEQVARFDRVWEVAIKVCGDPQRAAGFMYRDSFLLEHERPVTLVYASQMGADRVLDALHVLQSALEHGSATP